MISKLFVDLVIRTILIISITDALIFYFILTRKIEITPLFVIEVIIVTLVPMIMSLWFDIVFRKVS